MREMLQWTLLIPTAAMHAYQIQDVSTTNAARPEDCYVGRHDDGAAGGAASRPNMLPRSTQR
jgi:hypothetical protein